VDLDARLVERWRHGDERPEIPSLRSELAPTHGRGQALSETLTWQVSETATPFELDLAAFFSEVLG
jgi:hypothetical protein